jgi:Mrp family chromosome partitioning ATPase
VTPSASARALAALRTAGIFVSERMDEAPEEMEGARVARLLREQGRRAVGLAPADDGVAVPAIAILLGSALARLSGRPVGVVDAAGSWPGAPDLCDSAIPDGSLLATSWLRDGLAVLLPRAFDPGAALVPLRTALGRAPASFEHLVVDLTGFAQLGELPAATQLLDGALLVARSGRTTRRQVRRSNTEGP